MSGHAAGRVRRGAVALVAAACLFGLVGCGTGTVVAPLQTPTEPARPSPDSAGEPLAVAFSPLRGTPAPTGVAAHPSLGVKIDNHPDARPQIALNRADIVFEELVEGGLTRYLAVWHADVPPELGPVRSVRPMDPDIITPFGGIIAYSGGQQYFVDLMRATPVENLVFDYDETGLFSRADERPGPHDVILDAVEVQRRYADLPAPPVQFGYGTADPLASPALAAAPTSRIDLAFSEGSLRSWEWDAAASAWLRSQDGVPDLEASGERVRTTNVVTLRVRIDWPYGEVPLTVLVGSGEAWVSAAGRTAHGSWAKADAAAPIVLTADDGSPLRLAPGTSWVELVPDEGSVAFAP
jgi:hypothetical protein